MYKKRIAKREEDPADKWLRENDPYYTSVSKTKRSSLEYPYLTPDQEVRQRRIELPISYINSETNQIDADVLDSINILSE